MRQILLCALADRVEESFSIQFDARRLPILRLHSDFHRFATA